MSLMYMSDRLNYGLSGAAVCSILLSCVLPTAVGNRGNQSPLWLKPTARTGGNLKHQFLGLTFSEG